MTYPKRPALVDLDEHGNLTDPSTGAAVTPRGVPGFLDHHLEVPAEATDIVLFVHGWRNTPARAERSALRLFQLLDQQQQRRPDLYPRLKPWSPYNVIVRWPSMSNPLFSGYRRIRERAHAMSTSGHASDVIVQLLGYLNAHRRPPGAPPTLRTAGGQYLHCVAHSFGGRFIVEAIQAAADTRPNLLGWNRPNPRYPYVVDTVLVFQMAANPDMFNGRFARILDDAPINGPLVLTQSSADRATGLWHSIAQGRRGIGHVGASEPASRIHTIRLLDADSAYSPDDFAEPLVNVNARWRYRRGRWTRPEGAHSDIWHPESAHLLLSLADLAR